MSEDFDFFSSAGFDADRLRSRLPFFREVDEADPDAWVQRKRDTLEAFVDRGGPVKLAFFGGLDTLGRIEDPRRAVGSRVQVASLVDLAGMKMRVIQVRGSWKDYVDLHTLAANGIDISTGLAAGKAIDRNFDPSISIRALQFYGDGTLERVPGGDAARSNPVGPGGGSQETALVALQPGSETWRDRAVTLTTPYSEELLKSGEEGGVVRPAGGNAGGFENVPDARHGLRLADRCGHS